MLGRVTSEIASQNVHLNAGYVPSFGDALTAWTNVVGSNAVKNNVNDLAKHKSSTIGVSRVVPAVLRPANAKEIVEIVRIANRFRVPLYPVSTGKNWGYGDGSPVTNGCVVVDLSRMNRIIDFQDLSTYGVATIEPGVTQQGLHDYLVQNSLHFMTPTHGGGPDCSILGNALERGYGITPIANHFEAITSISAVLGNGTVHDSFYEAIGATALGDRRKSQVGPDLDGLFAQSNFGIVTKAKVRLPRRPRNIATFIFRVRTSQALAALGPQIQEILFEHYPKTVGAINLMNRLRMLAMVAPYPVDQVTAGSTISPQQLQSLGKRHDFPEWAGIGTLFGSSRASIQNAFSSIKKRIGKLAYGAMYLDERRVDRTELALQFLPEVVSRKYRQRVDSIRNILKVASGRPSRVALPLAYWRSGKQPESREAMNPCADGCGIIWYSPYVAIDGSSINLFREMVETTCRQYGIEPLITFTSIDEQTFDATIPILFNRDIPDEVARAMSCHEALLHKGLKIGTIPYRYGINQMQSLIDLAPDYWKNVKSLRNAWDPNGIIAPSRYCP